MAYYLLHAGQPSAQRLVKRVSTLKSYVSTTAIRPGDVVIRWGEAMESDPHTGVLLNPKQAVERTTSRTALGRMLRRVGIRVYSRGMANSESRRIIREYRIPMFDLSPLACFRSDSSPVWINQRIQRVQDSFREVSFDDDRVTARAIRLAGRVLHALGLEHGMVSIGATQKSILHVLDVTAAPTLKGRMLELFARAIEDYVERDDRLGHAGAAPFLLGSDVELMLRSPTGKMVLASKYLSRHGSVGCDDRSVQYDGKRLPLMELRPDPASSPLGLVSNLRETMMEATSKIDRQTVEWRAGSMPFRPYCTGGHIHFSSVPFSSRLVKALDNYVGVPLMMVEDQRTARLRRPKYGFLGDVRHKDYGGFEYRTPGSFVVSPLVTTAAFCLAYVAVFHHRELPITDIYDESSQQAFYNGDTEVLLPIVERNQAALRGLVAYERYREYIDPLFEMIREGRSWDESVDVRTVWSIPLTVPKPVVNRRLRRRRVMPARA